MISCINANECCISVFDAIDMSEESGGSRVS